jgi:hypothetical protein
MSTYTLRTFKPSLCANYALVAKDLALELIYLALSPFTELPPSQKPYFYLKKPAIKAL